LGRQCIETEIAPLRGFEFFNRIGPKRTIAATNCDTPTSLADLPAKLDHSEWSGVRFRRKPIPRVQDKSGHAVHLRVRRACDGDSHRWGRILLDLSRFSSMPGRITL